MKLKIKIGNLNKPKDFYVYLHMKETTNEVFYVGKGNDNRFKSIKNRSKYWKHVAEKHGAISYIIAHRLTEQEAFLLEKKLILKYGRRDLGTGSLVNLTEGGEGVSGYIFTPERREQCSRDSTGRKHTKEHKEYMSQIMKGRVFSDETLEKMSKARIGKKLDPIFLESFRLSRGNSKKVICIETGEIFNSASEAARSISGDPSSVSKCCLGKNNSHKGFKFKYFEEENAA